MEQENNNPIKENQNHVEDINDDGSLLKKKVKKPKKDPDAPKKILTEGQKRALTLMNEARTKKKRRKIKK